MKNYLLKKDDINRILSKYYLESLISMEEMTEGLINPVFLINGKYVLRIELHPYEQNTGKFKRESILFNLLPKYGIPTPQVIGFDDSSKILNIPYLLLKFIPGKNLKQAFNEQTGSQQKDISFQLGEIAKRIHSIIPSTESSLTIFSNLTKWVEKSNNEFEKYWQVVRTKDYLSETIKMEVSETFKQYKKINLVNIDRLIQGDFYANNFQINEGKIVGIFDFEYACIADPLWDLQKLPISLSLGQGFDMEEFLRGYSVTSFTEEEKVRMKMYSFHHGVWELWAVTTQFMPLGKKEIDEGKELIINTTKANFLL